MHFTSSTPTTSTSTSTTTLDADARNFATVAITTHCKLGALVVEFVASSVS